MNTLYAVRNKVAAAVKTTKHGLEVYAIIVEDEFDLRSVYTTALSEAQILTDLYNLVEAYDYEGHYDQLTL